MALGPVHFALLVFEQSQIDAFVRQLDSVLANVICVNPNQNQQAAINPPNQRAIHMHTRSSNSL